MTTQLDRIEAKLDQLLAAKAPAPQASRFAVERLELPIRRERAEDAPIEPASFDAAAMFDVIEHLFDPRAVLAKRRKQ